MKSSKKAAHTIANLRALVGLGELAATSLRAIEAGEHNWSAELLPRAVAEFKSTAARGEVARAELALASAEESGTQSRIIMARSDRDCALEALALLVG